jgi:hypothetical protein
LTNSFNRQDRRPYDTLSSAQTGQTVYMDSVTTKTLGMNYTWEQVRLDGSLIFSTNPEARWALFSGIGFSAGVSINSNTEIYYNNSGSIESHSPNSTQTSYSSYYSERSMTERFRNKTNLGFLAYVPLGIDFRMGKRREFWKRMHLVYELRPGINMTSVPELRVIANAAIQQGLGVKVAW